ncbi:uncharacterized protein LOC122368024 [Amphibalanus amphitrite]|uniref:uncharacterized protein LOC122368024 n=1 Tax=Amphibalanus amphitrite TaxID=1232801 RepID=UPI001C927D12|nr:uncharacterized protein LOC122368024 [Amphibalanus amphitrite]
MSSSRIQAIRQQSIHRRRKEARASRRLSPPASTTPLVNPLPDPPAVSVSNCTSGECPCHPASPQVPDELIVSLELLRVPTLPQHLQVGAAVKPEATTVSSETCAGSEAPTQEDDSLDKPEPAPQSETSTAPKTKPQIAASNPGIASTSTDPKPHAVPLLLSVPPSKNHRCSTTTASHSTNSLFTHLASAAKSMASAPPGPSAATLGALAYESLLMPVKPPTPVGPQALHWFVDRPTASRPGLANWTELAGSADSLTKLLLAEKPPEEPRVDKVTSLPEIDHLDGDDTMDVVYVGEKSWMFNYTCCELNGHRGMQNGEAKGSPSDGCADQPIPIGIHHTGGVGFKSISRTVRFQNPIQVSLKLLLDSNIFKQIAEATNAFARGRGASEAVLAGWRDTNWKEMFRFFFANLVATSIAYNREVITDELLVRNPLMARLMGPKRFLQLTRAFRLKHDDQDVEEFVDGATQTAFQCMPSLMAKSLWVYTLQTYPLGCYCPHPTVPEGKMRETISNGSLNTFVLVTVLKVGYCVLRMTAHTAVDDTYMSGNVPTPSPELLNRLLADVPMKRRFFVAVGGATLTMAEYFHTRGAYFIGSVGPQVYRLVDPEKHSFPVPEEPFSGVYMQPLPGIREVVLLRNYSRSDQEQVWIGYPVPGGRHLQTHLICNIGAGEHTRRPISGEKDKEEAVPYLLGTLEHHLMDNELFAAHMTSFFACEPRPRAPYRCDAVWHQCLLMHLLLLMFINGWHAHAHSTQTPLTNKYAVMDILHHLFGFMYDWVVSGHNVRAELSLASGGARPKTGRRSQQGAGHHRSREAKGSNSLAETEMFSKQSTPAVEESKACTSLEPVRAMWTADRTSEWNDLLWVHRHLTSATNEWHGSTDFEQRNDSPVICFEDLVSRLEAWQAIFFTRNARSTGHFPLTSLCAIGPRVMHHWDQMSQADRWVFHWGHTKMAPTTTTHRDGVSGVTPWRLSSRLRRRRSF